MNIESTNGHGGNGYAVDANPEDRPGVPMEKDPPRPIATAPWIDERQQATSEILKRKGLDELTPVFGDTIPPRGISGLMRRAAYQIPEHYTSHWLVLLLSDRVDAIEHNPKRLIGFALPIMAAAGIATYALTRPRKRTFFERLFT